MDKLLVFFVAAMLRWTLPVAQHDAAQARYEEIARDAAAVAFDPAEAPLYDAPDGRLRTLSAILAIASYESNFNKSVETGEVRGDHGRSWCFMQINIGGVRIVMDKDVYKFSNDPAVGWSGRDLVEDRRKCFRAGVHIARESLRICRDLSLYTSGHCQRREPKATNREDRGRRLVEGWRERGKDADYLELSPYAMAP